MKNKTLSLGLLVIFILLVLTVVVISFKNDDTVPSAPGQNKNSIVDNKNEV